MRSRIEVAAELRGGRTVIPRIRDGGHLAVRQTGEGEVHLVGTAAGPLGGDEVQIAITVGPGARLAVRGAAATLVLPARHRPDSTTSVSAEVAEGGHLDWAPQPTVVCAGAEHTARLEVRLADGAGVRLLEQVVLGRHGETGGTWSGGTAVLRDGVPLLRHTLRSQVLVLDGDRALITLLDTAVAPRPATCGRAVCLPLAAGGALVTATGAALGPALADLHGAVAAAVAGGSPDPGPPVPAAGGATHP